MEEWKPIPNHTGYEASNLGRIRSVDRYVECTRYGKNNKQFHAGKVLSVHKTNKSYSILYVSLSTHQKNTYYRLDRLVASAWIPNPNNFECVNHIDSNIENSRVDNLEWVPYLSKKHRETSKIDEEWRPIPGYEDLYQVSNTGKVRSISRVVNRSRIRNNKSCDDTPQYHPRELKPYSIKKKTHSAVYHLHRRYKPGYYGQTDVYWDIEDLIRLVFPEIYEKEN